MKKKYNRLITLTHRLNLGQNLVVLSFSMTTLDTNLLHAYDSQKKN